MRIVSCRFCDIIVIYGRETQRLGRILANGVTGSSFVRFSRQGLKSIRHYWGKLGDRMECRRQALKLRYWDERHLDPVGMLVDHTYESIKALAGFGVYELRLDDDIGGQANIRVVFFDPPSELVPLPNNIRPLRVVWILEVLPKKRNDWTTNELTRFRAQAKLITSRMYK